MPALLAAMDDALKEAGASADKARKAAEAVANDDSRFARGDVRLATIAGDLAWLTWMGEGKYRLDAGCPLVPPPVTIQSSSRLTLLVNPSRDHRSPELFTASITASATCGHSAGHRSPRTPLSSGAEVLWPRPEATGVADAMIEAEHSALQHQAKELADVFQRSSSHVEGRNGYLSLRNHQLRGLDRPRKRACLTAMHNFFLTRADGTTAAERFFGQKPRSMFAAILQSVELPPAPLSPPRRAEG